MSDTNSHPSSVSTHSGTAVVVPCYNEEKRISADIFLPFVRARSPVSVVFVNDGSKDRTDLRLKDLCGDLGPLASVLTLSKNMGKAEAVRQGMQHALSFGARRIGYFDADGATSAIEALELADVLDDSRVEVVMASRVMLAGRSIERRALRHYGGRVFATVASLALRMRIYDTQCGAKFFRASRLLAAALDTPFESRWAFDVELLARLLHGGAGQPGLSEEAFVEVPLRRWSDIGGSTLSFSSYPKVFGELLAIAAKGEVKRWGGR